MSVDVANTTHLDPSMIYVADDRYVCGTLRCAGSSAFHTNVTIPDFRGRTHRLHAVDLAEVQDWAEIAGSTLGNIRCECGALEAVPDLDVQNFTVAKTVAQ